MKFSIKFVRVVISRGSSAFAVDNMLIDTCNQKEKEKKMRY